MLNITIDQIRAAADHNMGALSEVLAACERRITFLAAREATTYGRLNQDLADDLAQEGRIVLWEALENFRGTTVGEFFVFMDKTLLGRMDDVRRIDRFQGVSEASMARFQLALSQCDGDVQAAQQMVQDAEAMGGKFRVLSADAAAACVISYRSTSTSLDSGEFASESARIASVIGVPEDLLEPADLHKARRQRTVGQVHDTLNKMGDQQRTVLMALTGIGPVSEYGADQEDQLAEDYDLPRQRLSAIRARGKDRFRTIYSAAYNL